MANYQIVGTKVSYDGKIVKIGDQLFTSVGGGIEGDRQQVEIVTSPTTNNNAQPMIRRDNSQDNVTTFAVGDTSNFGRNTYYYSNGTRIPNGTPLHHHTIPPNGRSNFMTQHTMNGNENDVFLTPSNAGRVSQQRQTRGFGDDLGLDGFEPSTGGSINPGGNTGGGMGGGTGGGSSY